jgi:hypothetical protein
MQAAITAPPFIPAPPLAQSPRRGLRVRPLYVVLAMILATPILAALGVASYFYVSSPVQALRRSVMETVPGHWDKKIAINVGWMTTAVIRFGAGFVPMKPEPRAALDAVRGAEVGIYKHEDGSPRQDYSATLALADKSMARRGYMRLVGVTQRGKLVAIYLPRGERVKKVVDCCVLVLDEENMVIVSARAKVQPLLDLAREKLPKPLLPGLGASI